MKERRETLQEAWTSFIVEFPTYPKAENQGRAENQRILFLCSIQEKNPTELCFALFGTQILIHRIRYGETVDALPGAQFIFLFASDTPSALGDTLAFYNEKIQAPVLVAQKSNVTVTAQFVKDYLSRTPATGDEGVSLEWGHQVESGGLSSLDETGADEASLWTGNLPDIVLVNEEGRSVTAAKDLQDYRAEYACRYVLAHYQENINRDKMAEMVNLSPGYFSNLFRAEVGMSFSDYLIQVRIENAKRLLRRFDLSVEAISRQCGFNSLAHFSRTFKDRVSLSPLKYRKSPHQPA